MHTFLSVCPNKIFCVQFLQLFFTFFVVFFFVETNNVHRLHITKCVYMPLHFSQNYCNFHATFAIYFEIIIILSSCTCNLFRNRNWDDQICLFATLNGFCNVQQMHKRIDTLFGTQYTMSFSTTTTKMIKSIFEISWND